MNHVDKRSTNVIDEHIGERIAYFRKNRQMTLQALADDLGITHQQLQKYERASNRVSASRLRHISDVLKVPVAEFFVTEKENSLADSANKEETLLYYFSRIHSAKQREMILQLVRSIIEP